MSERLQKILSQWGLASRRRAEAMIAGGRVRVNGAIAQMGDRADPAVDLIECDGVPLEPDHRPQKAYLLLNKPQGVVSTCEDPQGRPTVVDLIPRRLQTQGIHPVGRLDTDSTGALLLTNDGDLTYQLTHPRHDVPKTYQVWVRGSLTPATLAAWQQGIVLDGRKTRPATVTPLQVRGTTATLLEIVLREGRNRQIRRMAELLGHPVLELHRVAIGSVHLNNLLSGQVRFLADEEVSKLFLSSPAHPTTTDSRDASSRSSMTSAYCS